MFDPLLEKLKSLIKSHWQSYVVQLPEVVRGKNAICFQHPREISQFSLRTVGMKTWLQQSLCCLTWVCTPEPTVEGRTNSWGCPRPLCAWAHRGTCVVWFKTYYIGNSDSVVGRFQPPAFKWTLGYLSLEKLDKAELLKQPSVPVTSVSPLTYFWPRKAISGPNIKPWSIQCFLTCLSLFIPKKSSVSIYLNAIRSLSVEGPSIPGSLAPTGQICLPWDCRTEHCWGSQCLLGIQWVVFRT